MEKVLWQDAPARLNALAAEIHEMAVVHGWWPEEGRDFGEIISLIHSELSEALEEYRAGKPFLYYMQHFCDGLPCCFPQPNREICEQAVCEKSYKPEGIAVELIDTVIRILDFCARENAQSVSLTPNGYTETRLGRVLADCHLMISLSYLQENEKGGKFGGLYGAVSMIFEYLIDNGVDPWELIRIKMQYNATRPFRHGGKLA